ncbi:MAG TPA: hypothetical protein VH637_14845 [Streptosporangiaceae bacterium]|jgi:hypothetical protein
MGIAALIAWIITAGGGFVLLATWFTRGGARPGSSSRFSPAMIFGHFGIAAVGLVVWIIYVAASSKALAWIAFVLLVPVALLGFTMFFRWLPGFRARSAAPAGGPGTASTTDLQPAEQHFPVVVVGAHGLLAVTTVVLVLLAAIGVG